MTTTASSLELLTAGDPGYAETCRIHNGMHATRRPALVARPRTPADVAEALAHARAHGLAVSVRGGGHHVAGYALVDGGLAIDPVAMDEVVVDPAARTVRAGAGARSGAIDAATQEYGLAVTGGRDSTTGIGQALGSGSGWLEKRFGLTGDNLLAAELVTADGRFVRATAETEPDLFWALRGAGANFGVVTALELRLHPVGPVVYAGMLVYETDDRAAVLRGWRDVDAAADRALATAPALMTAPPAPFVPEHLRGRPAVGMFVVWTGDPARGEEACAPLRALAPLAVDMVQPMPYTDAQTLVEPTAPWGLRSYWKADNVRQLPDDAIDVLVAAHDRCPSPWTALVVEPKLGAIADLPEDATAVGARASRAAWYAFGAWEDPAADEANIRWARDLAGAMEPFGMPEIALNFLDGDEEERLPGAFGARKYERLRRIKRAWDPENVFRSCSNVAP